MVESETFEESSHNLIVGEVANELREGSISIVYAKVLLESVKVF
jgi:hypothetical protein